MPSVSIAERVQQLTAARLHDMSKPHDLMYSAQVGAFSQVAAFDGQTTVGQPVLLNMPDNWLEARADLEARIAALSLRNSELQAENREYVRDLRELRDEMAELEEDLENQLSDERDERQSVESELKNQEELIEEHEEETYKLWNKITQQEAVLEEISQIMPKLELITAKQVRMALSAESWSRHDWATNEHMPTTKTLDSLPPEGRRLLRAITPEQMFPDPATFIGQDI